MPCAATEEAARLRKEEAERTMEEKLAGGEYENLTTWIEHSSSRVSPTKAPPLKLEPTGLPALCGAFAKCLQL